MRVQLRSIETIRPYDRHARRAGAAAAAVAESIRRFGFRQPVVVDAAGVIICGHARWQAAKALGLARIPVHVAEGLAPAEARAYRLADNRLAEIATWDEDLLAAEVADLKTIDCDLEGLGFTERELHDLLAAAEEGADLEQTLPPPRRPVSRRGAIYRLGDHRLLVGDATKADEVARLMAGETADLLLTDPPYNVAYEGKTPEALRIENDAMEDQSFRRFLVDALGAADAVMRPGAVFYIWHADSEGLNFRVTCDQVGWRVRQCLIWVKNAMVLGRQDYQWRHEPCLYGWKDGAPHTWAGGRKQTTIAEAGKDLAMAKVRQGWCLTLDGETYLIRGRGLTVRPYATTVVTCDRPSRSAEHPTMKPVELFEGQVLNSSRSGEIVLDPFAGSGTTAIASQRAGRRARLMELDGRYADVIRRRWAEEIHGRGCDWRRLTPRADDAGPDGRGLSLESG